MVVMEVMLKYQLTYVFTIGIWLFGGSIVIVNGELKQVEPVTPYSGTDFDLDNTTMTTPMTKPRGRPVVIIKKTFPDRKSVTTSRVPPESSTTSVPRMRKPTSFQSTSNSSSLMVWSFVGGGGLCALLAAGIICWCSRTKCNCTNSESNPTEEQGPVYSYVPMETIPFYDARALLAANKTVARNVPFIPSLPARPEPRENEYTYADGARADTNRPTLPTQAQIWNEHIYEYPTNPLTSRPVHTEQASEYTYTYDKRPIANLPSATS